MRSNAVVVAGDEGIKARNVLKWLEAEQVRAYSPEQQTALDMVRELKPRLVVCSDSAHGMAFREAARLLPEPPMILVLSEDPQVRDDVYFDGLTVIAMVRTPVRMVALSQFIGTALRIAERLDDLHRTVERKAVTQGLLLPGGMQHSIH